MKKAQMPGLNKIGAIVIGIMIMIIMIFFSTGQSEKATNPINNQVDLINDSLNKAGANNINSGKLVNASIDFSSFVAAKEACWVDKEKYIDSWTILSTINAEEQSAEAWMRKYFGTALRTQQVQSDLTWCIITVRPQVGGMLGAPLQLMTTEIVSQENINSDSVSLADTFNKAFDEKTPTENALDTQVILRKNNKLCVVNYQLDNYYTFDVNKDVIRNAAYKEIQKGGKVCEI